MSCMVTQEMKVKFLEVTNYNSQVKSVFKTESERHPENWTCQHQIFSWSPSAFLWSNILNVIAAWKFAAVLKLPVSQFNSLV